MGRYIQTDSFKNKAAIICEQFNGQVVSAETAGQLINDLDSVAIVCVVDNGPFEAAAYCYSVNEFNAFNRPEDRRPKKWIAIQDVEKVREAAP